MVGLYTRKLKPNYTNRENLKRFFLSMSLLFLIDVPSHGSSKKLLFARDRDRLRKPPWSKHREQLVTECPTQQVRLQHNYRLHLRLSAHQCTSRKREQKDCKAQRDEESVSWLCLLEMTRQLHLTP